MCSISLSRISLFGVSGKVAELRHAVDHVTDEMEAVEVVAHDHIERRGRRLLLLVAANMDVAVVGAPVDQPGIAVMGKDDRLVGREQRIEIVVGNTVRMLLVWLQCHQIDDIDNQDFEVGDAQRRRSLG